jgi:hypothetical protein
MLLIGRGGNGNTKRRDGWPPRQSAGAGDGWGCTVVAEEIRAPPAPGRPPAGVSHLSGPGSLYGHLLQCYWLWYQSFLRLPVPSRMTTD